VAADKVVEGSVVSGQLRGDTIAGCRSEQRDFEDERRVVVIDIEISNRTLTEGGFT
jgi:hypothetical protein